MRHDTGPIARNDKPVDHEVRFICGVPSSSGFLFSRKTKFPLQVRHFRVSTPSDGGHEKLPGDGHETARWRT